MKEGTGALSGIGLAKLIPGFCTILEKPKRTASPILVESEGKG